MKRIRVLLVVVLGALAWMGSLPVAQASTHGSYVTLDDPAGNGELTIANGINAQGEIVGGSLTRLATSTAFSFGRIITRRSMHRMAARPARRPSTQPET